MTDKKKKTVCIILAVVLSSLCLGLPLLALAGTSEEDEILQDYDIQGYDENGNAILDNDDYLNYLNEVLAYYSEESQKKK